MSIKTKSELESAFSTGKKPTQDDFKGIFDSYFHKSDKIDVASTTNIYSKNDVDQIVAGAVTGDPDAVQFMESVNQANVAAATAQRRADDAYTLAEHADGPESLGYTWANTAHTRCGVIEGNMQQLTNSVENAIITANTNASTSSYGRVQLASNTGTSSDSGKVPVLGSNGKLNANVIPAGSSPGGSTERFSYSVSYSFNETSKKHDVFLTVENVANKIYAAVYDILGRGEKRISSNENIFVQSETIHATVELYNKCIPNGTEPVEKSGYKVNGTLFWDIETTGNNIKFKIGDFFPLEGTEIYSSVGGLSAKLINEV